VRGAVEHAFKGQDAEGLAAGAARGIGWARSGPSAGWPPSDLAAAGHAVKAYDISAAFHAAATEAGITPCNRLDDAVADAEFAITMVPTGCQVHDIWLG
jgi:hypothetical protein